MPNDSTSVTKQDNGSDIAAERTTENTEHMIPKSRFDEVIKQRDAAAQTLEKLQKQRDEEQRKALEEQNNYKELYSNAQQTITELKAKEELLKGYEDTLKQTLASQLAEIPETLRGLVPEDLTTPQKLSWLAKNKAILLRPTAYDIGAGAQGGAAAKGKAPQLTAEETEIARLYGMSPEEYAKFSSGATSAFESKSKDNKE